MGKEEGHVFPSSHNRPNLRNIPWMLYLYLYLYLHLSMVKLSNQTVHMHVARTDKWHYRSHSTILTVGLWPTHGDPDFKRSSKHADNTQYGQYSCAWQLHNAQAHHVFYLVDGWCQQALWPYWCPTGFCVFSFWSTVLWCSGSCITR